MINFRKATQNDLEELLNLIEVGFTWQDNGANKIIGNEHRVLFSYLFSSPSWEYEHCYLAEQSGKILAAVGVFPRVLAFEEIHIPIWAISPVVTHPDFRGQGIARDCLYHVFEDLKKVGISAVFLWGLPDYYPKLGFVPILPRYKTKINLAQIKKNEAATAGKLRECTLQDLKAVSEIYNQGNNEFWLQPLRNLEWWQERYAEIGMDQAILREVPFPKKENFLVWENSLGKLAGYLNFTTEFNQKKVIINEALTTDLSSAMLMLQSFIALLQPENTLFILGTPNHPLNIAAYRFGGIHLNPAPLAGMIRVNDWPNLIKTLNPLFKKRVLGWISDQELTDLFLGDQQSFNLKWQTGVGFQYDVTNADTKQTQLLTKLLFGLYDQYDMQSIPRNIIETRTVIFPPKYPFIWDANYLY